jgi:hypothetical protein
MIILIRTPPPRHRFTAHRLSPIVHMFYKISGIRRVDLGRRQADFDCVVCAIVHKKGSSVNTGLVLWSPALMFAIFIRLKAPSAASRPENALTRPFELIDL